MSTVLLDRDGVRLTLADADVAQVTLCNPAKRNGFRLLTINKPHPNPTATAPRSLPRSPQMRCQRQRQREDR